MDRTKVRSLVEQMSGITNTYLITDFDFFTREQINNDINYIKGLIIQWLADDDVAVIVGYLSDSISSLHVARGYATPDIPREKIYYQSMQEALELFLLIRKTFGGY